MNHTAMTCAQSPTIYCSEYRSKTLGSKDKFIVVRWCEKYKNKRGAGETLHRKGIHIMRCKQCKEKEK